MNEMPFDPAKFSQKYNEARERLREGVGGLLLRADGCICAVSRKTDRADLGLPGGSVESGENTGMALRRELREELGIKVGGYHRLFAAPDPSGFWFVTCLVLDFVGEPHDAEKKGAAVVWVKPERLLEKSCSFRAYNADLFRFLSVR